MTQSSHRIYELTCEQCGEVFAAGRRDKRFCSERCARKSRYDRGKGAALEAARADKACFYCGEKFTPKRSDAVYCSFSCSRKSYYNENKEMVRARQRARIQANPEKRQEALARFAERHPDNGKQRYAKLKADPERIAAERARTRQYYLDHKEEALERAKRQRERFPTKVYSYKHGCDWDELIAELWHKQDGKCYLCGDPLNHDVSRSVNLDHDHSCCPLGRSCAICRRGLSCPHCNKLIGGAFDDPIRLRRIADSLEVANALVRERMKEADLTKRGILFDLDEPA